MHARKLSLKQRPKYRTRSGRHPEPFGQRELLNVSFISVPGRLKTFIYVYLFVVLVVFLFVPGRLKACSRPKSKRIFIIVPGRLNVSFSSDPGRLNVSFISVPGRLNVSQSL